MTIIVNKCKGFGVRHSYYLKMSIYSYYCKSMFVYEFMIRKLIFSWYTFPIHKYSQILHIDDWIWRNENYIYLCTPAWPNLLFMECILSKGLIPRDSMLNWKRSCFLYAWISQFCRRGAPIGRQEFAGSRPIAAQLRPPIWGLGWVQRNLILSTGQFKCVGIYTLNKEYRYKCYFL